MATTAVSTAAFLGGLGVNTHLSDTLGPYGNLTQVKAELAYVGIGTVRDGNALSWTLGNYAALATSGIKFDLGVPPNPGYELGGGLIQNELDTVARLLQLAPGSVIGLEGQNEPWQFPDTFNGRPTTDWSTVTAVQNAIAAALRADPALAGIPLLSPSVDPTSFAGTAPSFAGSADIGNAHVYPWGGNQPQSFIAAGLAGQQTLMPGRQSWVTEFGYSDTPGDAAYGVDDVTQAKNTLNGLLDAFKLGAARTFLYELVDETSNISPNTPWGKLGLFNADGSAKPVAVALHNLTTTLADVPSAGFVPGSLDVTVSGLPATASKLLLEKSTGVFDLVLWNEAADWNPSSQSDVTSPAQTVTVTGPAPWASVAVFDPLASSSATARFSQVGAIQVSLTDHPVIIEIAPTVGAVAAAATPTPATTTITTTTVATTTNTTVATALPGTVSAASNASGTAATSVGKIATDAAEPVYRFFDGKTGTHFVTTDATEATAITNPASPRYDPSLVAEQNGYGALTPEQAHADPAAVAVYRLFNLTNGTHFFTASQSELTAITTPGGSGYRSDLVLESGSTFFEHSSAMAGDVAIYRFFDATYGTHFYTSDQAEYDRITTPGTASYRADLKPEGISFYAPSGSYIP